MSKEDDIREILEQAAQIIAQTQDNPRTWLSWIVYFLARLEDQAAKISYSGRQSFVEMLSALRDEIRNRLNTGGWL